MSPAPALLSSAAIVLTLTGIVPATGLAQAGAAPNAVAKTEGKVEGKVEVLDLAPVDLSYPIDVSAHGGHFAAVVAKGSRVAVSVDGVEGPRFDEILATGASGGRGHVAFSPDGSRYAYVARLGQEFVVMVDGKEMLRAPVASSTFGGASPVAGPAFTANGKHIYFVLYTHLSSGSGDAYYQFVYDGQPGPRTADPPRVYFSPSGDRHAYVVINPVNREQTALIVDGKPAGYPAAGQKVADPESQEFLFTADGAHLFVKTIPPRGVGVDVLVDGRAFMRAVGAQLYMAPVGNVFATVVTRGAPGTSTYEQFVDIAGKPVPGSNGQAIDMLVFSADAKHWAARVTTAAQSKFVIADGKKGLEYQDVRDIDFTAAGTVVYGAATNAGKHFVVVGEEESDAFDMIFPPDGTRPLRTFLIAGNHVGFPAMRGNGFERAMVVDGKMLQRRNAVDLVLSPDGSRFAFAFDGGYNVDGTDVPGFSLATFRRAPWANVTPQPGRFLWSPDSRHLVAFGAPAAGGSRGVIVDGKYLATGVPAAWQAYSPLFTPDGRHLTWFDRVSTDDPHWVIFVDGKPTVKLDDDQRLATTPGTWEMGADGVLTVIGRLDGMFRRFRITPGSDTSIETLLSKAKGR